jgi:hypothetical protein
MDSQEESARRLLLSTRSSCAERHCREAFTGRDVVGLSLKREGGAMQMVDGRWTA